AHGDAAADLDAGEAWHPVEADDVSGCQATALQLDEEIRPAGEKAPIVPEARGQRHRLRHAGRLMELEPAHDTRPVTAPLPGRSATPNSSPRSRCEARSGPRW